MTIEKVLERFLEVEKTLRAFDFRASGRPFWFLARQDVFEILFKRASLPVNAVSSSVGSRYRKTNILKYGVSLLIAPFKRWRKASVIVFPMYRHVKDGDRMICKYTNGIADEFGSDAMEIESLNYRGFRDILFGANHALVYSRIFHSKLKKKISARKKMAFDTTGTREIENHFKKFFEEYRFVPRQDEIADLAGRTIDALEDYQWEYDLYSGIMERLSPRVVIVVSSSTIQAQALSVICHDRNVRIIEIQTGPLSRLHSAYNTLDEAAARYFPDNIFVFGRIWKNSVRIPFRKNGGLVPTGLPYYEKRFRKSSGVSSDGRIGVLVLSQSTYGRRLSELSVYLRRELDDDFRIYFKPHPNEYSNWMARYGDLRKNGVVVVDSDEISLYELFEICRWQIGICSMSVVEGVGFGLETIIVKEEGYRHLEPLLEQGFATLVDDNEQVLKLIKKGTFDDSVENDVSWIWAENSMDNIKNAIEKIMAEHDEEIVGEYNNVQ